MLGELTWEGVKSFRRSPRTVWKLSNGTNGGLVKSYENLTFLLIFGAGHMVPWYQPQSAFEMIQTFLNSSSF
jgi:carboxypeptidase C (cathepsin A)